MNDQLTVNNATLDQEVELGVYLSKDRTVVFVDCPNPLQSLDQYVGMILAKLEQMELPDLPSSESLGKQLQQASTPGEDLAEFPLIQGTPLQPSTDSSLHWMREFFAEGWLIDEVNDTIDFREKVENCSVCRNELLLRKTEPEDGVPGVDVFGIPIPATKPIDIKIRCGKGISEVPAGGSTSYYAEYDGRVIYKDNTLSIDEVFAIHGNVDLKSGNIHHTGSITIDGDICNGAVVEADGDIIVKGLIEQSNVKCGGTLTVAGGIIGDEEHKIQVGGNLEARYIRDAHVSVEKNILVNREISHSIVRSRGFILVPTGRIAGGTTTALKCIRMAIAGAPGSAKTTLVAGVDFSLQDRLDIFLEKISHLEATLAPVEAALKNAEKSKTEKTKTMCMVVEDLSEKRMIIGHTITMEYMQIDELSNSAQIESDAYVIMCKETWSGTTIQLGEFKTKVKQSISTPRIVQLHKEKVKIVPLGESNMPPELHF